MGRVSRTIGFPVTGQVGAFVILSLLERQELEFGYDVRGEFYIEFYLTVGHAVYILHKTGVLFGRHRLVKVLSVYRLDHIDNLLPAISEGERIP
jgi:hypothetical protein